MILILGGGLAGMSTAYHLGDEPHLVVEGESTPGGLCRSREIDGFVFDYTGHLLHLRDERISSLVDELTPGVFEEVAFDRGGEDGSVGEDWLIRATGDRMQLESKCTVDVEPGDELLVLTPGGGGWGDPGEKGSHRDR